MEISYCFKCRRKILGSEFSTGQAFQVKNHVTCSSCAADLLGQLTGREREQLLALMFKKTSDRAATAGGRKAQSSTAIPELPAAPRGAGGANRGTARREARTPSSSPMPWIVGGTVGVGLLIVVLVAGSGSGNAPIPPRPPVTRAAPPVPAQIPVVPEKPKPDRPKEEIESAYRLAAEYAKSQPRDVRGQSALWEKALWAAEGTPRFAEIQKKLEQLKELRNAEISSKLETLDAKTAPLLARESFKEAIALLYAARERDESPEWRLPVDKRIAAARESVSNQFEILRDAIAEARKHGQTAKAEELIQRVKAWGFIEFTNALPAPAGTPPTSEGTRVIFADDFETSPGRFDGGEIVPGKGVEGSKAFNFTNPGAYSWLVTPLEATPAMTIRFSLKSESKDTQVDALFWSAEKQDNARVTLHLKKGEWKHFKGGAAEFRFLSGTGEPLTGKRFQSVKFVGSLNRDDVVLLDDVEIRQ